MGGDASSVTMVMFCVNGAAIGVPIGLVPNGVPLPHLPRTLRTASLETVRKVPFEVDFDPILHRKILQMDSKFRFFQI